MEIGGIGGNFSDVGLVDTHEDIFRLDIRVDDLTFRMKVLKTLEDLDREDKGKKYLNQ